MTARSFHVSIDKVHLLRDIERFGVRGVLVVPSGTTDAELVEQIKRDPREHFVMSPCDNQTPDGQCAGHPREGGEVEASEKTEKHREPRYVEPPTPPPNVAVGGVPQIRVREVTCMRCLGTTNPCDCTPLTPEDALARIREMRETLDTLGELFELRPGQSLVEVARERIDAIGREHDAARDREIALRISVYRARFPDAYYRVPRMSDEELIAAVAEMPARVERFARALATLGVTVDVHPADGSETWSPAPEGRDSEGVEESARLRAEELAAELAEARALAEGALDAQAEAEKAKWAAEHELTKLRDELSVAETQIDILRAQLDSRYLTGLRRIVGVKEGESLTEALRALTARAAEAKRWANRVRVLEGRLALIRQITEGHPPRVVGMDPAQPVEAQRG